MLLPFSISVSPKLPLGTSELFRRTSGLVIIPQLVLGLLVCLLIAGTGIPQEARLSQGWVMFVSVTVFLCSMAQLTLYLLAIPEQTTAWVCLETAYYGAAFALYFSAATLQANFTASGSSQDVRLRLNTAATVFIFAVVTLYGFSFLISLKRWKDTRAGTDAMKAARQASESPAKP
ncbi:protein MAL2-like [Lampetra fluviatilis]